jgi:uncharacterized protein
MKSLRRLIKEEELFLISKMKRHILYVPLRGMIFEINDAAAALFYDTDIKLEKDQFFQQISAQLLEEKKISVASKNNRITSFEPYTVGVSLTNKCNLSCVYCHADSGPKGSLFLKWEIAKAAIDFAYDNAKRKNKCLELSFPGTGEPTQAWDLLRMAISYAEEITKHYKPGVKIVMSTNGVFRSQCAEYIADHFTGISLSLDGPRDIQDRHRGIGTFDAVFSNASLWYKRKFLFSIRVTVSELSVDRMSEIWNFFEEHFPGTAVSFERMNPLGRGSYSAVRPPSISRFNKNFEKLMTEADNHKGLLLNSGIGKLNQIRTAFCKSFSFPSMTVTPDGHITACTRDGSPESFYYGKWNENKKSFDIDMDKVIKFRSTNVDTFEECISCFGKYHCGGDCYDLRRAGIRRCATNKRMIFKDILNKLDYDKSISAISKENPNYVELTSKIYRW